jgi:hypothetical protein
VKEKLKDGRFVAKGSSAVVKQQTLKPEFKGSNQAAADTGRVKIKK